MAVAKSFDTIRGILETKPYTRKCDAYLVYEVWKKQMGQDKNKISLVETMSLWRNKKITSPSTITRARREVQHQYPYLKDEDTYNSRKAKEEMIRREYNELGKHKVN